MWACRWGRCVSHVDRSPWEPTGILSDYSDAAPGSDRAGIAGWGRFPGARAHRSARYHGGVNHCLRLRHWGRAIGRVRGWSVSGGPRSLDTRNGCRSSVTASSHIAL